MKEEPGHATPSNSHDVFVSYARVDQDTVAGYVARLREADISIWIDQQGIEGSDLWSGKIVDAIKSAKVFMVFCSNNSFRSVNVTREIFLAAEEGSAFLPIYLEAAEAPAAIRYHFAGIQHIEAFKQDFEQTVAEIVRVVVRMEQEPTSMEVHARRSNTRVHFLGITRILGQWFTKLPVEARFSIFFSLMGIPGWFFLSIAASFGIAADVRTTLCLGFLFTLGLLFNLCGIVTAGLGLKRSNDFEVVLIVSLLLNAGQAIAAFFILNLGAKGFPAA